MAAFHQRSFFHHKVIPARRNATTTRTTTMSRVRCSSCHGYFERDSFHYANGLTRICTEQCFNEWRDRKKPTGNRLKQKRAFKASAPTKTPIELRFAIKERDGFRCRYGCGRAGTQVHHVAYRSEGGSHEPSNLITLCEACHRLVHSNKRVYKPLLLATIWLHYVAGLHLTVPEVARYLESNTELTESIFTG